MMVAVTALKEEDIDTIRANDFVALVPVILTGDTDEVVSCVQEVVTGLAKQEMSLTMGDMAERGVFNDHRFRSIIEGRVLLDFSRDEVLSEAVRKRAGGAVSDELMATCRGVLNAGQPSKSAEEDKPQ